MKFQMKVYVIGIVIFVCIAIINLPEIWNVKIMHIKQDRNIIVNHQTVCRCFHGKTIVFTGDSIIRNFHQTFIEYANNYTLRRIDKSSFWGVRKGTYYMKQDGWRIGCDGNVRTYRLLESNLKNQESFLQRFYANNMVDLTFSGGVKWEMLLLHSKCHRRNPSMCSQHHEKFLKSYEQRLFQRFSRARNRREIFLGMHMQNMDLLVKHYHWQSNELVQKMNKVAAAVGRVLGFEVYDFFNITRPLDVRYQSRDGVHFGKLISDMKLKTIMNDICWYAMDFSHGKEAQVEWEPWWNSFFFFNITLIYMILSEYKLAHVFSQSDLSKIWKIIASLCQSKGSIATFIWIKNNQVFQFKGTWKFLRHIITMLGIHRATIARAFFMSNARVETRSARFQFGHRFFKKTRKTCKTSDHRSFILTC